MDRRTFLKVGAVGAGTAFVAGCSSGKGSHKTSASSTSSATPPGTSSPGASASPLPSSAAPGTAGPADWSALAHDLSGTLVLPQDAGYDSSRLLFNSRYDGQVHPAAIAYASSEQDIATCVGFAKRYAVPIVARSGGHSYAGYSGGPGLVVDVSGLSGVSLDQGTATVGSGARLVDVYADLAAKGVTVPAGSCPTVGVAGLTLGGGIGVTARAYGLTCDNLTGARVVTADGRILDVNAQQEPDLFWALRGGGGGNFGIVSSLSFQTRPAPGVAVFFARWPWQQAAAVIRGWQAWLPGTPDDLWTNMHLEADPQTGLGVSSGGLLLGGTGALNTLVDDLTTRVGSSPSYVSVTGKSYTDAMLYMAGCTGKSVAQCHLGGDLPGRTSAGTVTRDAYAATSDVYAAPLPDAGITAVTGMVERGTGSRSVAFDSLGGAVGRVAVGDTAFPHRNALWMAQYIGELGTADPATVKTQTAWLSSMRSTMRPWTTGGAYVNYADPGLGDWADAYYGPNLARLRQVRQTYDPQRLFAFPQGL